MAFLVQGYDDKNSPDAISIALSDRQEALTLAARLRDEGLADVRIIGDGRIYSLEQFALTVINDAG
jgi:hypothetical protein